MSTKKMQNQNGFSLIEILMVLFLVAILTYVSLEVVSNSVSDARFDETVQEMRVINDAIVGNKKLQEGGARTSFGYYGDVGALPASFTDLTVKPAGVSAYTVSSTNRVAYGWNGPYLESGDSSVDYTTDGWGTSYVYNTGTFTITSYGANKVAGGTGLNQDIVISLPANERLATVEGFISNAGAPVAASFGQVELNYPDGVGGLTQSLQYNSTGGYFSFASVPYGVRSITFYQFSRAAPVKTVGPVVITVDKPRVLVPAAQLDVNP